MYQIQGGYFYFTSCGFDLLTSSKIWTTGAVGIGRLAGNSRPSTDRGWQEWAIFIKSQWNLQKTIFLFYNSYKHVFPFFISHFQINNSYIKTSNYIYLI